MILHLLLTPNIAATKPGTCKIVADGGGCGWCLERSLWKDCVVEDTKENLIQWLKLFDEIPVGISNPSFNQFKIVQPVGADLSFID